MRIRHALGFWATRATAAVRPDGGTPNASLSATVSHFLWNIAMAGAARANRYQECSRFEHMPPYTFNEFEKAAPLRQRNVHATETYTGNQGTFGAAMRADTLVATTRGVRGGGPAATPVVNPNPLAVPGNAQQLRHEARPRRHHALYRSRGRFGRTRTSAWMSPLARPQARQEHRPVKGNYASWHWQIQGSWSLGHEGRTSILTNTADSAYSSAIAANAGAMR